MDGLAFLQTFVQGRLHHVHDHRIRAAYRYGVARTEAAITSLVTESLKLGFGHRLGWTTPTDNKKHRREKDEEKQPHGNLLWDTTLRTEGAAVSHGILFDMIEYRLPSRNQPDLAQWKALRRKRKIPDRYLSGISTFSMG
jgi:hypothetical protein